MLTILFAALFLSRALAEPIGILVIGESGVGKSTFINKLMGREVAKVCSYETGTFGVDKYRHAMHDHDYNIWDTRGFNDPVMCDNDIMKMITNRIDGRIHIVFMCFDLSNPRLTSTDIKLERQFHEAFQAGIIGGKPIIVFTKANMVPNADIIAKKRSDSFVEKDYIMFGQDQISIKKAWVLMDKKWPGFDFVKRRELCSSRTIIQIRSLPTYPQETSRRLVEQYNHCIEVQNAKTASNVAAGSLLAVLGMTFFGIATGGAGFLAMAAAAGGGSLAAGGAGVAGGYIMMTAAGAIAGVTLSAMSNGNCREYAFRHAGVNELHTDSFVVSDTTTFHIKGDNSNGSKNIGNFLDRGTLVSGKWENNKPIGVHDANGVKLTAIDGVLEHKFSVVINGKTIDCDWTMI